MEIRDLRVGDIIPIRPLIDASNSIGINSRGNNNSVMLVQRVEFALNVTRNNQYYSSISGVYVPYIRGNIANVAVGNGENAFSGFFSGCALATYSIQGQRYVAHVAIDKSNSGADCRDLYERRILELDRFARHIKPYIEIRDRSLVKSPSFKTLGVVDRSGDFYSLYLDRLEFGGNEYKLLKCEKKRSLSGNISAAGRDDHRYFPPRSRSYPDLMHY